MAHQYGTIADPTATIANDVPVGLGSVVIRHAILQAGVKIGQHVIINTSASVDHDCQIYDFAHIGPNVTLCGNVSVGEGTLIGAGAVLIPGITIGSWSVIGAGTVVRESVPDNVIMAGNPGRIIKVIQHEK